MAAIEATPAPTKVLHVIGRLVPGGVEMRTLELIEQSTDKNVQHYICVSSGEKGTLDDRYLNAGASVEYLKLKSILFPFKFYVFLKNNSFDVVHSNLMYVSGLVLLIAKLARIPV